MTTKIEHISAWENGYLVVQLLLPKLYTHQCLSSFTWKEIMYDGKLHRKSNTVPHQVLVMETPAAHGLKLQSKI